MILPSWSMNRDKYFLYFDDTGSRKLGQLLHQADVRQDGMDCFGLGGLMVKEEDIQELNQKHKDFCSAWGINYPLHSSRIRGHRGKFGWLSKRENQATFLPAMEAFLLSLPFVGIACVVDRPGYAYRYQDRYHNDLWPLPKTTFCILVERASKFADASGRDLQIFFEECGKKEDRLVIQYLRELKTVGNPFDQEVSGSYEPLDKEDYCRIVQGEPKRLTKKAAPLQVADLILYPMAKGGYDDEYHPYHTLKESGKLIDCLLSEEEIGIRGIKYSCFRE